MLGFASAYPRLAPRPVAKKSIFQLQPWWGEQLPVLGVQSWLPGCSSAYPRLAPGWGAKSRYFNCTHGGGATASARGAILVAWAPLPIPGWPPGRGAKSRYSGPGGAKIVAGRFNPADGGKVPSKADGSTEAACHRNHRLQNCTPSVPFRHKIAPPTAQQSADRRAQKRQVQWKLWVSESRLPSTWRWRCS